MAKSSDKKPHRKPVHKQPRWMLDPVLRKVRREALAAQSRMKRGARPVLTVHGVWVDVVDSDHEAIEAHWAMQGS